MSAIIFELGREGRQGCRVPLPEVPITEPLEGIPSAMRAQEPPRLPQVAELDLVRHFTRLSHRNYSVDSGFYPLGSCTMKYNPRINEQVAALPGFAWIHPYQPDAAIQGALQLLAELEGYLCRITGMDAFTLQPAAGAHGELTALLLARAWFKSRGEERDQILVPDSAHGTNPASAVMGGFEAVQIRSDSRGNIDLEDLAAHLGPRTAVLMLTNPNTLGLFDEHLGRLADMVHQAGGLLYYDGANLNATLGVVRPGDAGFDLLHLNLHKTFSTPHGGGGPGSGPVGVKAHLADFLPVPRVVKGEAGWRLNRNCPQSIGRVRAFYGNFLIMVRAYAYILSLGEVGLKDVARHAVLNANYMMEKLGSVYELPYPRRCMHEFVLSATGQKQRGARALDIAKRLLDLGFHAPTIYFPLIVDEAMMIEPTETENLETLDRFIAAMLTVDREIDQDLSLVTGAPHGTPVGRLDEVSAARKPDLAWEDS